MGFDPAQKSAVEDIFGHWSFEGGVADEEDHGEEAVLRQAEELFEGADVEMVLAERVLEPFLVLGDLLGPLGILFGTEDPTAVVLRFDHEDAEG